MPGGQSRPESRQFVPDPSNPLHAVSSKQQASSAPVPLNLSGVGKKKAAAQAAEEQKRIQKLEKGRLPPSELFRPPQVPEGTYSQWAENGLPTHDGEGKELSKNQVKKVQKEWAAQEKLHQAFLEWQKEKGGQ